MEFTEGNLLYLEKEWFEGLYPEMRLGQTICDQLNVHKEIEDKIF